jgi:hypothetical protein
MVSATQFATIDLNDNGSDSEMHTSPMHQTLNAEDRKVYQTWLRGTVAVYGMLALCGIALVLVQATTDTMSAAEFMTIGVALAAP